MAIGVEPAAAQAAPGPASRREARRQAILEAAAALFLEKGYGATSLSDVVARSGGSLATLYEMFGNKAGLLRELILDRCREVTAGLDRHGAASSDPREALTDLGRRLFDVVMSDDAVAVVRLIVAEGGQFPELAPLFFATGPENGRSRVSEYLARQTEKGVLRIGNAELAARQFCDLVRGEHHFRAICGMPHVDTAAIRERHVREVVDFFLAAYRARPA